MITFGNQTAITFVLAQNVDQKLVKLLPCQNYNEQLKYRKIHTILVGFEARGRIAS